MTTHTSPDTSSDTGSDTGTLAAGDTVAVTITIDNITFDCVDAARVAAFWSVALGRPVAAGATPAFAAIPGDGTRPGLLFNQVPEPRGPKNRVHLDLASVDRQAAVAWLLRAGATAVADHDEAGSRWTTLRDVEGNELCVA